MQTTLELFRTRISAKLGLDNTVAGDQTLIDSWVNEGVEKVLLETRCKVDRATLDLTADAEDYTLDASILRILDLTISDIPLIRKTVNEIVLMRGSSPVTDTSRYYAVAGANLLMLYPTPSASDELVMYYVPRPVSLSVSSDSPDEIPSEWHKLVEWYALAEGADYDDDGSSGQGALYMAKFDQGIRDFRKSIVLKGGTRLAPNIPGRRQRVSKSVPSQDI